MKMCIVWMKMGIYPMIFTKKEKLEESIILGQITGINYSICVIIKDNLYIYIVV